MSRTAPRGLDARPLEVHPSLHVHAHRVRRIRRLLGAALLGSLLALTALVVACPEPAHAQDSRETREARKTTQDVEAWRQVWVQEFRPVMVAADRLGRELSLPLPRPVPFCRDLRDALERYAERGVPEAPTPLLRRHVRLAENAFDSAVDRCLKGKPTALRAHLLRALGSLRHLGRELERRLGVADPRDVISHGAAPPRPPAR